MTRIPRSAARRRELVNKLMAEIRDPAPAVAPEATPTVDQVLAELDARDAARAEAQRKAALAARVASCRCPTRGCVFCGIQYSCQLGQDGALVPAWSDHGNGHYCGLCRADATIFGELVPGGVNHRHTVVSRLLGERAAG